VTPRAHVVPLLVAAAVVTAGCGGPDRPLKVGFKEVPSNVVLGAQTSPEPVPSAPPLTDDLPFVLLPPPSVIALPPPPFAVPDPDRPLRPPAPLPEAPVCEPADLLQAPALEAPSSINARPAAAQYRFRNDGTFRVSGADAREGRFAPVSLRTVSGALEADSGFVFDVTEVLGDVTTKTEYEVVTSQPLGSPFAPGIYVFRVTSRSSDGQESVFTPSPSLPLATFPLTRGAAVEARGVDATSATAMSYTSTVVGKDRVDACGELLDSWTLELTAGRVLSPETDLEFEATYALGTQFGGVILRETEAFTGTEDGAGVARTLTSTISQVPQVGTDPQP
jgi:hypothetical protein